MEENLIRKKKGVEQAFRLFNSGANLIDIGGESTRPGSKKIKEVQEWNRIKSILKLVTKKNSYIFRYKKIKNYDKRY